MIATENGLPKPALYDHLSYKRAMHYILSTSQVKSILTREKSVSYKEKSSLRLQLNMIVL